MYAVYLGWKKAHIPSGHTEKVHDFQLRHSFFKESGIYMQKKCTYKEVSLVCVAATIAQAKLSANQSRFLAFAFPAASFCAFTRDQLTTRIGSLWYGTPNGFQDVSIDHPSEVLNIGHHCDDFKTRYPDAESKELWSENTSWAWILKIFHDKTPIRPDHAENRVKWYMYDTQI